MSKKTQIVKFQGDEIEAVREGADVWISVRRVCEALGIAFSTQRRKLLADEDARVTIMITRDTDGREQEMFVIEIESLTLWLASINSGKVRPQLRPQLRAYKREAARVLRAHFFPPAPVLTPPVAPVIAGTLRGSPALLADVRRLVGAGARASSSKEQRVRGWLVREFGAASYLEMPLALAAYARERLMRFLCGEEPFPWLTRRRALPAHDERQQEIVFPAPARGGN